MLAEACGLALVATLLSRVRWARRLAMSGFLRVEEADALNPPVLDRLCHSAVWYEEVLEDDRWLQVGYIPTPRSRLGWFAYDVAHGLAMHYPVGRVLAYALFGHAQRVAGADEPRP